MTIPDDIMRAARECADTCLASSGLGDTDKYADVIALAITSERERCAKVAEAKALAQNTDTRDPEALMQALTAEDAANEIAATIRKGEA